MNWVLDNQRGERLKKPAIFIRWKVGPLASLRGAVHETFGDELMWTDGRVACTSV